MSAIRWRPIRNASAEFSWIAFDCRWNRNLFAARELRNFLRWKSVSFANVTRNICFHNKLCKFPLKSEPKDRFPICFLFSFCWRIWKIARLQMLHYFTGGRLLCSMHALKVHVASWFLPKISQLFTQNHSNMWPKSKQCGVSPIKKKINCKLHVCRVCVHLIFLSGRDEELMELHQCGSACNDWDTLPHSSRTYCQSNDGIRITSTNYSNWSGEQIRLRM